MSVNGQIKIGIVGLGKMGLLHGSILNRIPEVKVVTICEKKKPLVWYGNKLFPNVKVTNNIMDFSNLGVDAAVVSAPIPSHSEIIESLFSIGINNIFSEKTLTANRKDSIRISELGNKKGGTHMVGYMARHAVTFRKAKELLGNGIIGKIGSFKGYAYSSDFLGMEDKSFLRGGVIRDLGSHIIDLAFWFLGEMSVETAVLEPSTPVNGESNGHFTVKVEPNLNGEFDISWCKKGYRMPDYGLVLKGSDGTIEVNNDSIILTKNNIKNIWNRIDLNDNVPFMLGASEYYREDVSFIDAVNTGAEVETDFFKASKVDNFIELVKEKTIQGTI